MKTRVLAFVCLCAGIFHAGAGAEALKEPADKAAMDYSSIMSGLPWHFIHASGQVDNKKEQEGTSVRYQFVSTEPLGKTTQRHAYLRADLTVTDFNSPELAAEGFRLIQEKADPDMGLSYAWDYLILNDTRLYHIHTGCMMSEGNFGIMVGNLRQAVLQGESDQWQALQCTCGGGCETAP